MKCNRRNLPPYGKKETLMSFKTELHCHSKDISPCSHQDVDGIVEKYTGSGYSSLVLANHAGEYIFDEVIPDGPWKSKVD